MSTSGSVAAIQQDAAIAAAAQASKPKVRRGPLGMGALALVAAAAGTAYYVTHLGLESTDDSQVDGEVVSVPTRSAGLVTKVSFVDNQIVHAGDVLAELDAEPAKARLAQAEANLAAAQAAAEGADADARVAETNAKGNKSAAEATLQGASASAVASQQQINEGEAQIASATATFDRNKLELERAKKLAETG